MTFGRSPFTRVVSPSLLTLFVVRLSEEIQYVNLLRLFLCSLLRPVYFLDPSIYPLQLCMLLHVILNDLLYYLIKLNEDQLPQTSWLQRFEFLGLHVVDLRVFQTFWGGGDRPGTTVSLPAWGDSRSWSAFSEENNLNSSGQAEAGFQDVIRLLRQDKAVSPWLAAAARVVPLLMTQLGWWRSSCLRGERENKDGIIPALRPTQCPNLIWSSAHAQEEEQEEGSATKWMEVFFIWGTRLRWLTVTFYTFGSQKSPNVKEIFREGPDVDAGLHHGNHVGWWVTPHTASM